MLPVASSEQTNSPSDEPDNGPAVADPNRAGNSIHYQAREARAFADTLN